MKKEIKDTKEVVYDKLIDITCDICTKSCLPKDNIVSNYECLEITSTWGFDSKKDGEKWVAHICEECTDTYLKDLILFQKTTYNERVSDSKLHDKLNKVNNRKRKIREICGVDIEIKIDEKEDNKD